jgi:hypothetical protein
MADEIQIHVELTVDKGNLNWRSNPNRFNIDYASSKAPSPGGFEVPTTGKRVDLGALSSFGVAWIHNLDDTNFVTVGVYDGSRFHPVLEVGPGEFYPVKLSRYLTQEFIGTGTGTNADVNQFMMIADTAACYVEVYAFER